jgi:hypothetical protein
MTMWRWLGLWMVLALALAGCRGRGVEGSDTAVTLLVAHRLAVQDAPHHPWRAFPPWAGLATFLLLAAIWLMAQPMEMRGTFLGG